MPDAATVTPFPTETEAAAAVPAPKAPAAPADAKPIREISDLSPAQQEKWRMEGVHPDLEGEKAPAVEKDSADEGDGEVAAPKPAEKAPRRLGYGELRARVKELEAKLEEKAATGAPPRADAKEETPAPAPKEVAKVEKLRPRPKPEDIDAKGEPKYKEWTEYEDDLLAWADEKREIAHAAKTAEATKVAEVTAANKVIEDAWWNRVEAARELHPDFDQSLDKGGPGDSIQAGSLLDGWIMHSELGAEVFYYLHKNPDYFAKLKAMPPIKATKALAKLEDELEGASIPAPKPSAPAVRTSKTPAPHSTVGGRGTVVADEVEKAVADDDVRGYIAAQNRREIAAAKGR